MKRVYVLLGSLSLALGILGIFLPLLPTTPFLLLTAALWIKGSPRLYQRLLAHKRLGPYIRQFREQRAIPLRAKIVSVSLVWITLGYSAGWLVENPCCAFSCWHWLPASQCTSSPTAPSEGENKPHLHNAEERTKLFTSRRSASREKHERSLPAQKLGPGNPCLARVRTIIIKVYPTNN